MAEPYVDFMPYQFDELATPVIVIETDPEVTPLSFSETLVAGTYVISVSLVSQFITNNDILEWRVEGNSFTSDQFSKSSVNANENVPLSFDFPFVWVGGLLTMDLIVSVPGNPGNNDVTILSANLSAQRVA